eukprot:XP_001704731.1 Hypothetical protein GL50803_31624 [Giardia lamblia ATCC 50803]
MSSWAVAAVAMNAAMGWLIGSSLKRTAPSLVILMSPAPETSILYVPAGPKLVRISFVSFSAASMFISSASPRRRCSAFWFRAWIADMKFYLNCKNHLLRLTGEI